MKRYRGGLLPRHPLCLLGDRRRPMERLQVGQTGTDTWPNEEGGFTLTEITIVVAILGLLLMIAEPNYLDWNRKYNLKDAGGTLHGDTGLRRRHAITQKRSV